MTHAKEHEIQDRLKALEHWERTCDEHHDCHGCPYEHIKGRCIDLEEAVVKLTVAYREIQDP